MSDHVVPGGAGTELAGFVVDLAADPSVHVRDREVSHGSEAGRTGWAHVLISVSATSPAWKSNSKLTVRKYGEVNL